jgi:hypothetical protein
VTSWKLRDVVSRYWWYLLIIGIVAVPGVWFWSVLRSSDELQGKPTYSALQGIELTRRSPKLVDPVVIAGDPDTGPVIGVPTDDVRFPNAWIATSRTAPDGKPYIVSTTTAKLIVTCRQAEIVGTSRPKSCSARRADVLAEALLVSNHNSRFAQRWPEELRSDIRYLE